MFNFFSKQGPDTSGRFYITDSDFNHICNVLRMKKGDEILVSFDGKSHLCVLEEFSEEAVSALITQHDYRDTELSVKIHLFQGLPKSDKLELIIQKCTELGVNEITPVEMRNCVVRLEDKKKKNKTERWQSIAESAAKQSKRNIIPTVNTPLPLKLLAERVKDFDLFLVPYENEEGMRATKSALCEIKNGSTVGILIGPEGGFDESEIEAMIQAGARVISLGRRILRTETAAITAVFACMLYCETEFEDDTK